MSEITKQGREAVYSFLEKSGVDVIPLRPTLKKLLVEYAKSEHNELLGEVIVLRDLVRKHRAIISSLKK